MLKEGTLMKAIKYVFIEDMSQCQEIINKAANEFKEEHCIFPNTLLANTKTVTIISNSSEKPSENLSGVSYEANDGRRSFIVHFSLKYYSEDKLEDNHVIIFYSENG
jgi:hypothetical protein